MNQVLPKIALKAKIKIPIAIRAKSASQFCFDLLILRNYLEANTSRRISSIRLFDRSEIREIGSLRHGKTKTAFGLVCASVSPDFRHFLSPLAAPPYAPVIFFPHDNTLRCRVQPGACSRPVNSLRASTRSKSPRLSRATVARATAVSGIIWPPSARKCSDHWSALGLNKGTMRLV